MEIRTTPIKTAVVVTATLLLLAVGACSSPSAGRTLEFDAANTPPPAPPAPTTDTPNTEAPPPSETMDEEPASTVANPPNAEPPSTVETPTAEQEMPELPPTIAKTLKIRTVEFMAQTEYVELLNFGTQTINLNGWVIKDNSSRGNPFTLPDRELAPQQTVRIYYGADAQQKTSDTETIRGGGRAIWNNGGDQVKLFAPDEDNQTVDTCEYGAKSSSPHRCDASEPSAEAEPEPQSDATARYDGPRTLRITCVNATNPEYVKLHNTGEEPIQLAGWKIVDQRGAIVNIQRYELRPNSQISIYNNGANNPGGGRNIWNNDGDEAQLFTPDDFLVGNTYTYSGANRCGGGGEVSQPTQNPPVNTGSGGAPVGPSAPVVYPDTVELVCVKPKAPEYVRVRNTGQQSLTLTGWQLTDLVGNKITIGDVVVNSSQTVDIYSDGTTQSGSGRHVWNDEDDTARILNPNGEQVGDALTYTTSANTCLNEEEQSQTETMDQPADPPTVATTVKITRINFESSTASPFEFVELLNTGTQTVDLLDWSIKDDSSSGNSFSLTSHALQPQQTVRVYYGYRSETPTSEGIIGRSTPIWNDNGGDVAYLYAPHDTANAISTCAYTSAHSSLHDCDEPQPTEMMMGTPPADPPDPLPVATTVKITQINFESSTASPFEFVELFNIGTQTVDLLVWNIKDDSGSGNPVSLPNHMLQPQQTVRVYYGYGSGTPPSGGIVGRSRATWNNSGDTAKLFKPGITDPVSTCAYTGSATSPFTCP